MATERRNRLSPSWRNALKNVIRLIPAVVIIAAMLNTVSCNNNNGLLTPDNGNGSATPTATATAGTGALAFVTNFNDGMVSSFTRNTKNGKLTHTGQVTAGAKGGPKGVVASPNGSFLYVANNNDDNIYEFSVNQTTGALTPLPTPSIGNGNGSLPDELAINPAGTFLWVTGPGKGTVTGYSINGTTGQLTQVATKVTGLSSPFGIAVDSTGSFVYVADVGAGLVYSYSINTSTGVLSQIGSPIQDLNAPGGTPGFIAIDPAGTFVYVTDFKAGLVSVLATNSGTLSFGSLVPSTATANKPLGIAYAAVATVANFIFTANQGTGTLWSFQIPNPGFPAPPVSFGSLSTPTEVVVDPQNAFLYTTNQGAGTVSQFSLSKTCIAAGAPCFVQTIATEKPANPGSQPFGITLAQ